MPDDAVAGRLERGLHLLLGPPRVAFHLTLIPLAVGLLWIGSAPGMPLLPLMWVVWLLALGGLLWAGKLTAAQLPAAKRHVGDVQGTWRWFVLAPIGGVIVVALLVSGLAFELRWSLSEARFDAAVAQATDAPRDAPSTVHRVGLYDVYMPPVVVGDAVVFHHPLGGGLFDDAGFAYLPAGPTPELDASFESLRVEPIGGGWYRWWSSW